MLRKILLITLLLGFFSVTLSDFVFASSQSAEYLCQFGVNLYQRGQYEDALSEFRKVLMIDPANKTAQKYINTIFLAENTPVAAPPRTAIKRDLKPSEKTGNTPQGETSREEAIDNIFNQLSRKQDVAGEEASREKELSVAGITISGEAQARLGMSPEDTYWKRANWDLNEKNWRIMSSAALDKKENTYDPRIYDRLRVNLDTEGRIGFGLHANITVDPWSFTGKSSKFAMRGTGGDAAEIELKYWSNTGYTVNESINSLQNGDSFSTPEIKILNGSTTKPVSITSAYNNVFTIPETKIRRQFQPLRELRFDYIQDNLSLKVFPIAYENAALAFDDPLRLSNNRIWWEDSPWLHAWARGNFNSGANPEDFTKGYWDNTLSFFTRDSEGQRLTALRGFSFEFNPQEETSFVTSIASPKTLWQDYSEVDNFLSATRLKQKINDSVELGLTATTRLGFDVENDNRLDAKNYVFGTDLAYEIVNGIKANAEVAYSRLKYDITNSQYNTEDDGYAYHFSLQGRFPFSSIMNTKFGYNGIAAEEGEEFFTKFRLSAARMDSNFDAPLSSYVETRDDEWWGRHLHFRKPFKYYYQGEGELLSWDDIKNFNIGNGLDIGRSVLGLRVESALWEKKIENLFDVRNVHATNTNKFVENVARDEITWEINDKLTTKMLGIYHRLPRTKKGFDPFIFDPRSRRYFVNDQIEDGLNTSVSTGSLGMEYEFFQWLALNGIWEYTNDISLNYDNFPRGTFNTGARNFISSDEGGNQYRDILNSLYNQAFFPKPPYPYYNIFKAGLRLNPTDKLEFYLDYTRNPYAKAGQVDDNMNHVGFELGYKPLPKLSLFFKYSYSRWQDLDKLTQGITKIFGHHNFFSELIYRKSEYEDFTFQYGEASRNPYMGGVLDIGWDPYGGSLRTIDTQHIFRLYYRRKF